MRKELVGLCFYAAIPACMTAALPQQVKLDVIEEPVPASEIKGRVFLDLLPGVDLAADFGNSAQILSLYGREDQISAFGGHQDFTARHCNPLIANGGEVRGPAVIDEIVRRAEKTSIVIVSESHSRTLHRNFIAELASRLRAVGYSIYAAEAFTNFSDEGVPQSVRANAADANPSEPYFRLLNGGYTQEAAFGRLGRTVKALGYELVAYEQSDSQRDAANSESVANSDRINRRDQSQAENLMKAVFDSRADAKVLIHVGYAHAEEAANGRPIRMLAARLKERTGINPLTVNQFTCVGSSDAIQLSSPPDEALGESYDLFVDHPLPYYIRNRPSWRVEKGDIPVDLPAALAPRTGWRVIEARPADEPDEAAPMDTVAVRPDEDIVLMLPPGKYRVRAIYFPDPH